jgi:hypothetical protein
MYDGDLQKCKDSMSKIIQDDPSNLMVWISYIEGEHLKNNNT